MPSKPGSLRTLKPMLRQVDTRTTPLTPKQIDPIYNSPEFIAFRTMVLRRAGHRCEAKDNHGHRCIRAAPDHRMYADHIVELRDGGSLLDINNGQALCASHHELKTIAERARRHRS